MSGGTRHHEEELAAVNFHDLMRVNEARNIRAVAEALAASAIERRETRGGAAHVRVDYPQTDDENGRRIITVERAEDELRISSRPTGVPAAVLPDIPEELKELGRETEKLLEEE